MPAMQSATAYVRRFLGLGWARVFLALGVLFTVLALVSPLWSITADDGGGDYAVTTFGWGTLTTVVYQGGVWTDTVIQSYARPNFLAPALASAMGASYIAMVVFLVILVVVFALFSLKWFESLPGIGLLIVALVVVISGFVALLYPVLTAPGAAALTTRYASVNGYWGSLVVGGTTLSWGAALGWFFLLIGLIFGIVGGIWPYLKSMRQPMVRAPPPREWQVER